MILTINLNSEEMNGYIRWRISYIDTHYLSVQSKHSSTSWKSEAYQALTIYLCELLCSVPDSLHCFEDSLLETNLP